MGEPAFTIIGDDVREPLMARAYARKEGLGWPSLAEAFNRGGILGEAISMRDFFPDRGLDTTLEDGASFPDNSVLLMIGNTQELVDACKKAAEDARPPILAIYTKRQGQLTPLTVAYACIEVHWLSRQVDILIAIGPRAGLLGDPPDPWKEYLQWWYHRPTYVTTPDWGEPYALPNIIRWIGTNDGKAWINA
jgi:hypothetical protein